MKDPEAVMLVIVGIIAACLLFLGLRAAVKKVFYSPPKVRASESQDLQREQRQRMREIQDRQKQLMQDQRQKIRDLQRR